MKKFLEFLGGLLEAVKFGVNALVVVAVVIFGVKLWDWVSGWFDGPEEVVFGHSSLQSVAESDALITSLAQVDVLWIASKGEDGTSLALEFPPAETKVEAFCLHTYEVAFGYTSLRGVDALDGDAGLPAPEMMAIQTLRSEAAPVEQTAACLEKNAGSRRGDLEDAIAEVLHRDGVLGEHEVQGRLTLAVARDFGRPECFQTQPAEGCALRLVVEQTEELPTRARARSSPRLEGSLGNTQVESALLPTETSEEIVGALDPSLIEVAPGLGAVRVTFSLVSGVNQKRRWALFFEREGFLLQRDVAVVTYGSYVAYAPFVETQSPLRRLLWGASAPRVVRISEPTVLAVDRWTADLFTHRKIEKEGEDGLTMAAFLNQRMLALLESGLARVHDRATASARAILTRRLLARFPDQSLDIRFEGRSQPPSIVLEDLAPPREE